MMSARTILPISAIATLLVGLLLASAVSATVRHTQELPASFVAIAAPSGDGSKDQAPQLASSDLDGDGYVGQMDLMYVIETMGSDTAAENSTEDVNLDGQVNVLDLAMVALNFGPVTIP